METNNVSKDFYLHCKEDGIKKAESKADVARILLTAKNNGITGTEEELIKLFNDGKAIFEYEQKIEKDKIRKDELAEIRKEENKRIEAVKELTECIGSDKPVSMLREKRFKLSIKKGRYAFQRESVHKLGMAMYEAGEIKEKDWAIHGGIASGIAGDAAGLATALDIQRQNEQAKEHNQQLMGSITKMQSDILNNTYVDESAIDREIEWLSKEIENNRKRLVEKFSPIDLLAKLNPKLISQECTETGAVKLTVETQPTPDIKIYDEVSAVVDGSFKAVLIDKGERVGEVLFALPFEGAVKKEILEGFCVDTQFGKTYDVVFIPINLWAIETKEVVSKAKNTVELSDEYKAQIRVYYAKDIVRGNDENIEKLEMAIDILKDMSDCKQADTLIAEYKEKIELCKIKAEQARLENENRIKAEKEKKERTIKNVTTATIATILITIFIIASVMFWNNVIIPNREYDAAVALMQDGKNIEAMEMFDSMDGYKDSEEKSKQCYFNYIRKEFEDVEVGEHILFGKSGTDEIEWIVLDKQDNRLLVISKEIMGHLQYNAHTWENCNIRDWLNNEFVHNAFSEKEEMLIPTITVSADVNGEYSENPTQDRLFLLSINEAYKYFKSDSERACGVVWWLRTPSSYYGNAPRVYQSGEICEYGGYAGMIPNNGIRPAMWIDFR